MVKFGEMRFILPFFIVFTTLVSATVIVGQLRDITEAELNRLISEATEKRMGLSQREKTSTVGYDAGDSSETLYELGPNNSMHFVRVRRTKGVETKNESISIGGTNYTRQKDGSWIKEPRQGTGSGSGLGFGSGSGTASSIKPETTTEYRFIGSDKIDGQRTSRYRKTHIVKFTNRTPVLTRKVVDEYWFNTDGLLLKESHEDLFVESNRSYKSVTEYEYDNDIKITAPIPD